jgi:hypothetical protein
MRRGKWRADYRAKAWVGYAVAEGLGLNPKDKKDRAKISSALGMWLNAGSMIIVDGFDDNRVERKFVELKEE